MEANIVSSTPRNLNLIEGLFLIWENVHYASSLGEKYDCFLNFSACHGCEGGKFGVKNNILKFQRLYR